MTRKQKRDADFYVYRQKDPTEILPWDFIETGVSRDFLQQEYYPRGGCHILNNLYC